MNLHGEVRALLKLLAEVRAGLFFEQLVRVGVFRPASAQVKHVRRDVIRFQVTFPGVQNLKVRIFIVSYIVKLSRVNAS